MDFPLLFFQLVEFISGGVIDSFCFLLSGLRGRGSSLPDRMKGADGRLHLSVWGFSLLFM